MQLSLILVATVWCVSGRTEAANVERANHLQDAHLIEGSPVNPYADHPHIADILVQDEKRIVKICEAVLVKKKYNFAYFLTLAECFDRKG